MAALDTRTRGDTTEPPARPARQRTAAEPIDRWGVVLAAVTIAVTLQALRVLFPESYGLAGRRGNEVAAATALAVFAAPLLAPALRRLTGDRARGVLLVLLAAWRVAVVLPLHVPLALAIGGAVIGLIAVTLVLAAPAGEGPKSSAVAILSGVAFDVVLRSAFASLDPAWQRTPAAVLVGALIAVVLVVATWRCRGHEAGPAFVRSGRAGVAVGVVLALEVLFLSSPAFVASSAGISLAWAVVVVAGGLAGAIAAAPAIARIPRGLGIAGAAVLAVAAFLLPHIDGAGVIAVVLVGQGAAALALALGDGARPSSRLRAELGIAAGWIGLALTVTLYQLHFDQPLPFDNRWVVTAAAVVGVAAIAVGRAATETTTMAWRERLAPVAWPAFAVALAGIVVAAGLGATGVGDAAAPGPGRPLRVVEWNIRQAVADDGDLTPTTIASLLTRDGPPDLVVLPEAARGWPLSGDIDLATWLSRRLDMPFLWAPAADNQFGTLVLSRLPILSHRVIPLPVEGRSQGRSLLRATIDAREGPPITVLATHLQVRNDAASVAARAAEIDVVLGRWAGAPRTIVIGDLNPRQGDPPLPARRPGEFPEIRAFLDAGFTTAQELTSCSHPTSGRNCSDFVLATPDLAQRARVIDETTFDHRPVVTTITAGPLG